MCLLGLLSNFYQQNVVEVEMLEEDEEDEEEDQICEVHEAQGGWNSILTRSVLCFFFQMNYCYCKYIQIRHAKVFFFGGGGCKKDKYIQS